jgi:hypothetical protein
MMKYYPHAPSRLNVATCVGKRVALDFERVMEAQREGWPVPARSWLWIVSPQRPLVALQTWAAVPMLESGWPPGFWQADMDERLCFVILDELPEREDTLILRLANRGPARARALAELDALPETDPLAAHLRRVVAAFQDFLGQD